MSLTRDQLSIWLADQAAPAGSQASVLHAFRIRGALNGQALVEAVRKLGRRHRALCLKIDDSSGSPEAVYAQPHEIPFEVEILPRSEGVPEAWVRRRLMAAAELRIDLRRAPAMAIRLLIVSASDYVFCFCGHHISLDDLSVTVLLRDLGRFYTQSLPEAERPQPVAEDEALNAAPEFYPDARHEANQRPLPLPWPGRNLRVHGDPRTAGINLPCSVTVDATTTSALRAVARRHNTTLFCLCAAAYQVVLGRYCLVDEVGVGVAFSLRANRSAMNEVGAWVSYVGVASRLDEAGSIGSMAEQFGRTLRSIRSGETACDLMGYSASIVRYLAPRARPEMAGLEVDHEPLPADSVLVELATSLREVDEGLTILMRGRAALFTPDDLEALMSAYLELLKALLSDGALAPAASLVLPEPMRQRMAKRAICLPAPGSDLDLAEVFDRIAASHPQAIALSENGVDLTYAALQTSARAMAGWLLSTFGLTQGDRVGLLLHRGHRLAIAHLGAMLAGLVIIPIDPAYPDERLERIAQSAGCKVLLCSDAGILNRITELAARTQLSARHAVLPAVLEPSPGLILPVLSTMAPAYIMYTSGSTGVPKGAILPRQALVRLALGCFKTKPGPGHKIAQFSSPGFDALFIELWGALLNGAALVCPSRNLVGIEDFVQILRQGGVTHAFLTTTIFNLIVDEDIDAFTGLAELAVGGEAMSAPHATRLLRRHPAICLVNVYGPTENGALSTSHVLQEPPAEGVISVPIGVPLPGNMAFVLDQGGHPVPDGFLGELWLGGQGLALGYDANEALTKERFRAFDPVDLGLATGTPLVLYRTGDRVRWDAGGRALEFHGRIDSQIKFNGFRIEPGEIEVNMTRVAGVRRAAVVAPRTGPGGTVSTIVAVFDPTDPMADPVELESRLRAGLSETLPRFMWPHRFLFLPEGLPVNASGKIDRKALEALVDKALASTAAPAAKRVSPLEAIWCRILAVSKTIPDADFFAMGGHSVLAMRLLAELKRELGLTVSVADFLRQPTLRFLERSWLRHQQMAKRKEETGSENIALLKSGPEDSAPLFCLPGLLGQAVWVNTALGVLPDMGRPVLGLGFRDDYAPDTLDEMAAFLAAEILEWHRAHALHEGPLLAGFSMGGFLAVAVTHVLEAAGLPPSRVIVIDPNTNFFPNFYRNQAELDDGVAGRMALLRKAHVLRPVDTRLDFVAATKSFPWVRLNAAEEWALLARGGIAVHVFDVFHHTFTQRGQAGLLASLLADLAMGARHPDFVLTDPWSDADLTQLALAAQDSGRGAYQEALAHLARISAQRQAFAQVRLQRMRLLEQTRALDDLVNEAVAMVTAPDNTSPVLALQLIETLDRLNQTALADRLDRQVLDQQSAQSTGILFLRMQRWLNAGQSGLALRLLQHPGLAEAPPLETGLMQILAERRTTPAGAAGWDTRLLDMLADPDAAHVHYATVMRSILQRGDDSVAEQVLVLAEQAFPGDPFRLELAAIWKYRASRWS